MVAELVCRGVSHKCEACANASVSADRIPCAACKEVVLMSLFEEAK